MGLFSTLFGKKEEQQVTTYFKTLNSYTPVYTSYEGGIYEMALTRACIHTFANHCSKLKPVVSGTANRTLERKLLYKPNPYMDTKKYLYRIATSYKAQNNASIIPLYSDATLQRVSGYYPIVPSETSIVEVRGVPYLKFRFVTGETAAIELSRVGMLNQFQYKDDFWGENNAALYPTMELINAQNQSIINGVKQSANIRFLAKISQTLKPKDMEDERKRLVESNLSAENANGVLLFDSKYEDVKQITSQPYVVDDKQSTLIRESVFDYFGMNDAILQNKFTSATWSSYYEGQIEPFAIELSLVHTNMTFTDTELSYGNEILFTVNRLQYLDPKDKLEVSTSLFDRGMLNADDGREIFQMPPLPNKAGQKYYIRREYAEIDALKGADTNANETDPGISGNAIAYTDSGAEANQ